jgi:predicted phage tail protein
MFPPTLEQEFIRVAGGGLGKGKGEAPDTLRSEATLTADIAISEGPLFGYATTEDLEKSVYLNKTPLRNQDGTRNFKNCSVFFAPGTQDQDEIPGFAGKNESDFDVAQTIRKDQGPLVRYINDESANMIRITLALPGLVEQKSSQVKGSTLDLDLKITDGLGAVLTKDPNDDPGYYRWTIDGKSTSQYEQQKLFSLSGNTPYKVEFVRITADSTDSKTRNDCTWSRYTLINFDRFRHPYLGRLGLIISSKDFTGIPEIGIRGKWLMCSLPHNYNPVTRTYTGIFDGRFTGYGWTNNPVYILREFMTNSRFGVGDQIDSTIHDNFSLYKIGKYCDGVVKGAFGEDEFRFVLNGIMADKDDADKQLTKLFEHIQALWFYAEGAIHYLQDSPKEISRIYSESNTLQDRDAQGRITRPCFEYEGTSRKARHNAVTIRFRNKQNYHQTDTAYYADEGLIVRNKKVSKEEDRPYCDSLGQALREAKHLVLTEKYQTQTIKFRVGSEGLLVNPGEVVAIADPVKQLGRAGGRIASVSPDLRTVTLDAPVTLKAGRNYSLSVDSCKQTITCDLSQVGTSTHLVAGAGFTFALLKARVGTATVTQVLSPTQLTLSGDPGLGVGNAIAVNFLINNLQMTRAVITPSGTTNTLTLISPLAGMPPNQSSWVLSDNIQPLPTYQIISVNKNSDSEYELNGIEYSTQKFAELGQFGDLPEITRQLVPPSIEALKTSAYNDELIVGWKVSRIVQDGESIENPNNTGYIVRYRSPSDNWITLPLTTIPSAIIYPVRQDETYEVQVAVVDVYGTPHYSDIAGSGTITGLYSFTLAQDEYNLVDL